MSGSLSTILQSSNSRHSSTSNTEHLRRTQYCNLCSGRVVEMVEGRTASMIPYGRRASKGTPIVAISLANHIARTLYLLLASKLE
ncbi:hypothetical protein BELL_0411g00050 [Botrytis elliptica]|uniref:Uncharacterized protein n=1 Tax=Botrytis elliptica TaxID=278938 RepID=A0A4Z1JHQ6_9HELO|nr:hypothetical protein BELL_0411g00050 [Botrytis elliptica]